MGSIMLNFRKDGKFTPLLVEKTTTVKQLYKIVRKKLPQRSNFYLVICIDGDSSRLKDDSLETIESIGLDHMATIDFCVRAHGGNGKLQPLPGYIEITTRPCDISYDDDPSTSRALMPCGCVIGPEAMKSYCNTVIDDGNFVFSCPSCDGIWRLQWVRHVLSAVLTTDEMNIFNSKLNDNFISKQPKIQPCPGCQNFLERDPSVEFENPNWVQCPMCTDKLGKSYEFCWICRKPWKGDRQSCGNPGCNGIDPRIQHLQTCDTKTIGEVQGVPSVRCCVKCGTLIYHKDQCKHMSCKCGYAFCFVCLKPNKMNPWCAWGGWQCGDAYSPCEVAPRQEHIFEMSSVRESNDD